MTSNRLAASRLTAAGVALSALVLIVLWPTLAVAEPPELSAERARELLFQIDHADYERRQSAERILSHRLGDGLQELVARELGELTSAPVHLRWRIGLLLDPARVRHQLPDDALFNSAEPDERELEKRREWQAEMDGRTHARTVRELLLDLQAGRNYSQESPAFVALVQLGIDARQQFLDAIVDSSLSNTLHYYALLAYQRVASPEVLMEDLGGLLTSGDSYLVSNIGQTFRNEGVPPDPVLALAGSRNPSLRILAAKAMASMRYSGSGAHAEYSKQVREALLKLLDDPIIDVAVAALGGLRNMGSALASDERVRRAAASGDEELAATAFECLRMSRDPAVLELAFDRCRDGTGLVRARALSVVGHSARMQPKRFAELSGRDLLEQAAAAPELGVRIAAYDAIGSAQIGQLTGVLRAVLADRPEGAEGPSSIELSAVIRNLSNLQDLGSLEALAGRVDDEDDTVRTSVLSALRRLAYRADDEQSAIIREAYRKVLDHTHRTTRFLAAQFLANIADDESLEALAPLVEDSDVSVRRAVQTGLSQLTGNERAAELLALALELDPEPANRRNLASYLMRLGVASEPVAEALKAALDDEDRQTGVNAAEAMERLGIPGSEDVRLRGLLGIVETSPSYSNLNKLRQAYADAGRAEEAAEVSPRIIAMMPSHMPPGYGHVNAARFALAAEDHAGAIDYLQQAAALGYAGIRALRVDPAFAKLREDEAFKELTKAPR